MHTFISTLQKEINKQVESIERSDDHQIEKAKKAFSILGDAFNKLREFIISYQFKDDAEEIEFFIV